MSRGGLGCARCPPLEAARKCTRSSASRSQRDVMADGRIAWSNRRMGMGVQFEKVQAEDQAAIDQFVDQHFFDNRKG